MDPDPGAIQKIVVSPRAGTTTPKNHMQRHATTCNHMRVGVVVTHALQGGKERKEEFEGLLVDDSDSRHHTSDEMLALVG